MSHTIALPDALNAANAVALRRELQRSVQQAQPGAACVLDASGVRSFDSAGLSLLLALRRHAQAQGTALTVQGWPAGLLALAQVYGVAQLLDPSQPSAAQQAIA